ncbi:unnamed protein product [Heligmosomoides polygyrus]|uniref:Protein-tyrosine phosphatase n=1 Tax=Heligmosomoides polygyrus TaxID=6339 RepID=A0A183GL57_HELPZ|nr:unnamed protein product [Heligmosomoides polygyrus]
MSANPRVVIHLLALKCGSPLDAAPSRDEMKLAEWIASILQDFELRQLEIDEVEKLEKIRTRHIHWIDWPDRGVPPADTAIIQVLEVIKSTQSPIVVHCSAGVGRTGSMVLIQYILESICLSEPIEDCNKILLRIRSQRANTIQVNGYNSGPNSFPRYQFVFQTDQQYLFVHQVLLNYFVENQLLDKRWKPFLNRFTAEYNKSVF